MSPAPQRRLLLGLSAALLCLALAAVALLQGRSPPARSAPPGPPSGVTAQGSPPEARPPVAERQRTWSPGTWYRYTLRAHYGVSFRSARPDAQLPPPMRFQLEGAWRTGVCSTDGERREVQVSFSPSHFSLVSEDPQALPPETRGAMLEALATPFFVTYDQAGAARLIHFEPQVDVITQGLLRSLVAATQVVLPSPLGTSWESTEEDSTGRYLARYQLQPPLQLEKTKLRYTHLVTDKGLEPTGPSLHVQVHSSTRLSLAREDLWPEILLGQETLEVDSGPDMITPGSESRVELRLVERGSEPSLATAFRERQPSLLHLPMANSEAFQHQDPLAHHRRVLAGRTLKDFLRDLRSLPTERQAQDKARSKALEGLLALFILEPASASQVPALLRTGLEPSAASPLLGALSAASTPESLSALARIVGDGSLALEVRVDATVALGMAPSPTEEGLSALRKLARGTEASLRETATLGLGGAAMHLRDTDKSAADSLVQELNSALAAATAPQEQVLLLRALGNTRAPSAFPSIQLFLSSRAPQVRGAAVEALRFMPAPQADTLLLERLSSDDSPEVRRAAVFAASFRPLEPFLPAFERVLRSDSATSVRVAVVQHLGSQAGSSPQARLLLAWSSQNDPEASVRQAAAAALGGPAR